MTYNPDETEKELLGQDSNVVFAAGIVRSCAERANLAKAGSMDEDPKLRKKVETKKGGTIYVCKGFSDELINFQRKRQGAGKRTVCPYVGDRMLIKDPDRGMEFTRFQCIYRTTAEQRLERAINKRINGRNGFKKYPR